MKDATLLLFSAAGIAALAWVLWHFLGDSALNAMTTGALIALTADNIRLRRQLRAK